jgi:exopolysaccharide production protein ExoY
MFLAPALLPLMALLACMVRFTSKGPVLFRQERIGSYGKPFTCLKFRTMHVDATPSVHTAHVNSLVEGNKPMRKLDRDDTRIIPFGRFFRAAGWDELPQVFNIIKGEMSFVGPRPCLPYEFESFRGQHAARFRAVPGLTGLWQVSGKNNTTFQQMVDLDIAYAMKLSFWHDVIILARTFPVLFHQILETIHSKRA